MTENLELRIAGRTVARHAPLYVIAELGLNHGGDLDVALALVDAAAGAGAAAVKLQSLRADRLLAANAPAPAHVAAASLRDFFAAFELDETAHRAIAARARARGVAFLSTPFDEDAVDMLHRIGCDALKIASGDLTHHRLIARAARTGLPLVISTGMAQLAEIGAALDCARTAGARSIALLHCVSAYPVPEGEENLRAIGTLGDAFRVPVGLSDHSTNRLAMPLAVALGAVLYERHLVTGHAHDAIDRPVSSTPAELHQAIETAAAARRALGDGYKTCRGAEAANRTSSRRGIYTARNLAAGDTIDETALTFLRPATSIDASRWRELLGRRVRVTVVAGTALEEPLLAAPADAFASVHSLDSTTRPPFAPLEQDEQDEQDEHRPTGTAD